MLLCHYRIGIQFEDRWLDIIGLNDVLLRHLHFFMFLYFVGAYPSQISLHSSYLLYINCVIQKVKILLDLI